MFIYIYMTLDGDMIRYPRDTWGYKQTTFMGIPWHPGETTWTTGDFTNDWIYLLIFLDVSSNYGYIKVVCQG